MKIISSLITCLLFISLFTACSPSADYIVNDDQHNHNQFEKAMDALSGKSLTRSESYESALDLLNDLGSYGFDEGNLSNCTKDDLEPYYLKRQIPSELRKVVQKKFSKNSASEIFEYIVSFYEKSQDTINKDLNAVIDETTDKNLCDEKYQDNLVMHLIWMAAKKGNVDALNEIGAAQIYCYQNTEQDIDNAIIPLQKAAEQGEVLAYLTLGKIYFSGLGGHSDIELGKKYQSIAFELAIQELRDAEVLDGNNQQETTLSTDLDKP